MIIDVECGNIRRPDLRQGGLVTDYFPGNTLLVISSYLGVCCDDSEYIYLTGESQETDFSWAQNTVGGA
jgi:hypothetical protein